jgi:hypothetical protein
VSVRQLPRARLRPEATVCSVDQLPVAIEVRNWSPVVNR